MKGFGMQVGDAEAVPQCAPVAPVVRLSGCMCQALNEQNIGPLGIAKKLLTSHLPTVSKFTPIT